jgi:hypothetical protein
VSSLNQCGQGSTWAAADGIALPDHANSQMLKVLCFACCCLHNRDSPFALDNNSGGGFGESPGLAPAAAAAATAGASDSCKHADGVYLACACCTLLMLAKPGCIVAVSQLAIATKFGCMQWSLSQQSRQVRQQSSCKQQRTAAGTATAKAAVNWNQWLHVAAEDSYGTVTSKQRLVVHDQGKAS